MHDVTSSSHPSQENTLVILLPPSDTLLLQRFLIQTAHALSFGALGLLVYLRTFNRRRLVLTLDDLARAGTTEQQIREWLRELQEAGDIGLEGLS